MHLSDLWFIAIAVLWAGYFVLEGFDFGVGILLPFLSRATTGPARHDQHDRPGLGRQRGLAAHRGRRDVRRVPGLVRGHVQRLLPAAAPHPDRADHPRRRVRVPRQAGRRALAGRLGRRDLPRLAGAGPAVGRRVRQHRARHTAERGRALHRELLDLPQPVRAARRRHHAGPVHPARRAVPRPEDHRRAARRANATASRSRSPPSSRARGSSPGPGRRTGRPRLRRGRARASPRWCSRRSPPSC